ncbi:hypothetical protein J1605_002077 [Eschrichtius robustus]|uniref:Uncharacterized protein n=1 Tax=Eschrichtius robustus TaxID=9764 RepID=A0AB34HZ92_ESCRO|nr:hypothetical protein J1605_002077 [Eschrichtius robustus]
MRYFEDVQDLSGLPRDRKSRKREVRAQISAPQGHPARAGVPPAQPPEPSNPDLASANAPPPPPPPISGAQGRGWLARRRLRRRAGTGGGPTAAQLGPPRADTGPSSRGRQRGPGEREEPASARPAVGGLVRHARRPPAPEVGSKPPGRWCPGSSPEPWFHVAAGLPASAEGPAAAARPGCVRLVCPAPRRWVGRRAGQAARAPRSRSPRCAAPPCGPGSGAPGGGALRKLLRN